MKFLRWPVVALAVMLVPAASLAAQDRTPDLGATVPSSWTVDRYAPSSFNLSNGINGRNDVLGIGIGPTGDAANRTAGQNATFYNTQGRSLIIDPTGTPTPASQYLEFDLWVDQDWASSSNGFVRTDMWARVSGVNTADNDETGAHYPILGFTNYGNYTGFRFWQTGAGWVNLVAATVNYESWNTLRIGFAGSTFSAWVNGVQYSSYAAAAGTERLSDVFLQAYNFNDPSLGVSGNPAYDAYWSNTPSGGTEVVPEPATMTLLATGLAGMAAARRRKAKKS